MMEFFFQSLQSEKLRVDRLRMDFWSKTPSTAKSGLIKKRKKFADHCTLQTEFEYTFFNKKLSLSF